jgi:hypothetical protein
MKQEVMVKDQGELAAMLQMLELEIPGFTAAAMQPPLAMIDPEAVEGTKEGVQFIATLDEVVFAFEDRLHLGNLTLADEHTIHTPGRLVAH